MTNPVKKINMIDAVKLYFKNYFNFTGRASRSEYWWAYLAYAIVIVVIATAEGLAMGVDYAGEGVATNLFYLATFIGWLSLSIIGKKLIEIFNNVLKKIPILRTIYSAIGQMTQTLTSKSDSQKSVVILEYPRKDIWVVGFATKENKGKIQKAINEELVNVFVPTTPNPTSGFLLMVPKKDLIYLDISFEQASKFIVSAGTTNIN